MNLIPPFLRRQPAAPAPLRFYAATKAENTKARDRRVETQLQLAIYTAVTPPEQRAAETEAYFAAARAARPINAGRARAA